jgi:hypothetical protein
MTRPDTPRERVIFMLQQVNVIQPSSTVVGGWSELPLLPPEHLPFVRPNLDGQSGQVSSWRGVWQVDVGALINPSRLLKFTPEGTLIFGPAKNTC